MIELRGWLVVPGAPRLTAVARHNRALIAAENHPPRLVRINPEFVIVIASGRPFERGKRLPSVVRLVGCGVRDVHSVRVCGLHADFPEVPPALPDAPVIRNPLPSLPPPASTQHPAFPAIPDHLNPPR